MHATRAVPRYSSRAAWFLVSLAVIAAMLVAATADAEASQSTNAQSLSFSLTSSDDFVLTDTEFWAYDEAAARTYFSNALVSGPTVSCTGGGPGGVNCQPGNQPPAPPAPDPNPNRLNPPVNNNKCVFFNGGDVTVQPQNSTYTQPLTRSGLNGSGNWRFTWTYQVAVGTGVNPVDERTAWILESSDPANGVPISASGWMAGQSTQNKTGKNARFKTSHGLLDSFGAARLENAGIELLDGDGNVLGGVELGQPGFPNYSVNQNENFYYITNAGTFNSPPGLLVLEGWVDDIQNGLVVANDGTTRDNFPGNDNQGGDRIVFGEEDPQNGEALWLADVDQPGTYTVKMFGTLKGNPGEITTGFSATKDITIVSDCTA